MSMIIRGEISAVLHEAILPPIDGEAVVRCKKYRFGRPDRVLLITPRAVGQLLETVEWGKQTQTNELEQGGLLIGRLCRDSTARPPVRFAVVEGIIPIPTDSHSPMHVDFSSESWIKAYEQLEQRKITEDANLIAVGWYHTHPGALTPDFSTIDAHMQRQSFATEMSFAVVLNPQRQCWQAYVGSNADYACALFQLNEALKNRYSFAETSGVLLPVWQRKKNADRESRPPDETLKDGDTLWLRYDLPTRRFHRIQPAFTIPQERLTWVWECLLAFAWDSRAVLYANVNLDGDAGDSGAAGFVPVTVLPQEIWHFFDSNRVNFNVACFLDSEPSAERTTEETRRSLLGYQQEATRQYRYVKWIMFLGRESRASAVRTTVLELSR